MVLGPTVAQTNTKQYVPVKCSVISTEYTDIFGSRVFRFWKIRRFFVRTEPARTILPRCCGWLTGVDVKNVTRTNFNTTCFFTRKCIEEINFAVRNPSEVHKSACRKSRASGLCRALTRSIRRETRGTLHTDIRVLKLFPVFSCGNYTRGTEDRARRPSV